MTRSIPTTEQLTQEVLRDFPPELAENNHEFIFGALHMVIQKYRLVREEYEALVESLKKVDYIIRVGDDDPIYDNFINTKLIEILEINKEERNNMNAQTNTNNNAKQNGQANAEETLGKAFDDAIKDTFKDLGLTEKQSGVKASIVAPIAALAGGVALQSVTSFSIGGSVGTAAGVFYSYATARNLDHLPVQDASNAIGAGLLGALNGATFTLGGKVVESFIKDYKKGDEVEAETEETTVEE